VGAYLKVHQPGRIANGDPVVVEYRPDHGVTVAEWVAHRTSDQGRRLLESGIDLAEIVRRAAQRLAGQSRREDFS
jgi:MOSC domain-containing protein YiiM